MFRNYFTCSCWFYSDIRLGGGGVNIGNLPLQKNDQQSDRHEDQLRFHGSLAIKKVKQLLIDCAVYSRLGYRQVAGDQLNTRAVTSFSRSFWGVGL